MYKNHVIKYFGNAKTIAKALKITSSSISQWNEIIPEKQALRLEKLTNGSLKYDPIPYKKAS